MLVDDKLRILSAVKQVWGSLVTTVFPRQGHYAKDPGILAKYPPPDISIGSRAEVEVFGTWTGCEVAREPLYDPAGERTRA